MPASVTFFPEQVTVEVSPGTSLLDAAQKAGIVLFAPCGGLKGCGQCKIRVSSSGPIPEPSSTEQQHLKKENIDEGIRLGCQFTVPGDACLTVEPFYKFQLYDKGSLFRAIKKKTGRGVTVVSCEAGVANVSASLDERIRTEAAKAGFKEIEISPSVLRKASRLGSISAGVRAAIFNDRVVQIFPAEDTKKSLGIALDLGTTTIACYLVDLELQSVLGESVSINPNGAYGSDVMSRISCISKNPTMLQKMQSDLIATVNRMIGDFEAKSVSQDEIVSIVAVGNTFMIHLFWGISPGSLGLSPYVPVFKGRLSASVEDLGLRASSQATVITLPCIAGFVGADTVGAIIATRLNEFPECAVLVDMGTNGEIVVAKNGRLAATSVAAGPAFEAVHMSCGMQAAPGAIYRVGIDKAGDLTVEVVDKHPPIGICGSGVISAVNSLLKAGVIDSRGIFQDQAALAPELRRRLIQTQDSGKAFVFAYADGIKPIYISQKDIRALQLAKAAVYTGIDLLLQEMQLHYTDIEKVYLAGAFGNYLDVDSAINLRILPPVRREKIVAVGNAAVAGAILSLFEMDNFHKIEQLAGRIEPVPLAGRKDFTEVFMEAMRFGRLTARGVDPT